ncbi:MAG: hypothetical protein K0R65_273 [Crocinitomicaceae bacterium]|jgi:hypothetical protein|nr:hypothetical protein [Crocinitomicaceae bacterium]
MDPIFPIYRKLSNSRAFYKINSPDEFEEIQVLGSKRFHYTHQARQYPEKLKIMDMIALEDGSYVESDENEFNRLMG